MKLCKIPCENLVMSVSYDFDWYYSSHGSTESQRSMFVYGGLNPLPTFRTGVSEKMSLKRIIVEKMQSYLLFLTNVI